MLSIYLATIEDEADKDRFERIYKNYKKELSKIAIYRLRNDDLAIDAVHSTMMKIAQNMKSLPSEEDNVNERRYIYTVLKYTIIDMARKKHINICNLDTDLPSDEYVPDDLLIAKEDYNRLLSLIEKMPQDVRDILILKYVNGLATVDIAKALNMNFNTAKSKLARGKLELKTVLSTKGALCE